MYWTEWGASPVIGKAGLDGSQPSHLVDSDIIWPNGLALDYQARRLYWVDSGLDRMEYVGFDGQGRRVIIENENAMRHPFGISVYQVNEDPVSCLPPAVDKKSVHPPINFRQKQARSSIFETSRFKKPIFLVRLKM